MYNEIEPYACDWLENLIRAGHIPPGRVERRSIADLTPADIPTTAHFFAGIGGWAHALRRAGWPDVVPVWTGSCPCQPFSTAGKRGGFTDARHLWPVWFRLIEQCRPGVVFGEQVSSPDGLKWLDLVSADLERAGYAVGAADLCAAGVGAPHIRQRLYFCAIDRLAHSGSPQLHGLSSIGGRKTLPVGNDCYVGNPGITGLQVRLGQPGVSPAPVGAHPGQAPVGTGGPDVMADPSIPSGRLGGWAGQASHGGDASRQQPPGLCAPEQLADPHGGPGRQGGPFRDGRRPGGLEEPWPGSGGGVGSEQLAYAQRDRDRGPGPGAPGGATPGVQGTHWQRERLWVDPGSGGTPVPDRTSWSDCAWIYCQDGKWRPVESRPLAVADGVSPGVGCLCAASEGQEIEITHPLAVGVTNRVGRLRGMGNAIVPQVAEVFIRAVMAYLGLDGQSVAP